MKTKLYTHKRQGGRYRIHFVAKGSGSLNTGGDDSFAVYHNELGQHFVRPLAEFGEAMNEVKKPKVICRKTRRPSSLCSKDNESRCNRCGALLEDKSPAKKGG